jgi:hypothetical protein
MKGLLLAGDDETYAQVQQEVERLLSMLAAANGDPDSLSRKESLDPSQSSRSRPEQMQIAV